MPSNKLKLIVTFGKSLFLLDIDRPVRGPIIESSELSIDKSVESIFIYTPLGIGRLMEGFFLLGTSRNPACFASFSNTVGYIQLLAGPVWSLFSINLCPSVILAAFSPSSKKYVSFDSGSVKYKFEYIVSYVSLSGFIANLYLLAQNGASCVVGIVTSILLAVSQAEQGKCSVLFSLTNAVVDLLNSSI